MLAVSLILIFGVVGIVFANLGYSGGEPAFGFQQIVHARIPWLLLAAVWAGGALGIFSLIRKHRFWKYIVVVPELAVVAFVSFMFLQMSWLPAHELDIKVGEAFPSYALLDQDENLQRVQASTARSSALYIFYRGDW
jgi:hypothetical protein